MKKPTETDVFEAAHAHVMKWEGGYFDHKDDPGGVTMYGVSLMFLKGLGLEEGDLDGDGDVDRADVLKVTRDTAKTLFKRHFWDKPKVSRLPPLTAVCFYDLAVNAGAGRAARILQETVNVTVDGVIGAKTLAAISARKDKHIAMLFQAYRTTWYRDLVRRKPSSRVFLGGWLNRTSDCSVLIDRLSHEWGA